MCCRCRTLMAFLHKQIKQRGGTLETRRVESLNEIDCDVLVNCTGLAAKQLVNDDSAFPIRGQTIKVCARMSTLLCTVDLRTERLGAVCTGLQPEHQDVHDGRARRLAAHVHFASPRRRSRAWGHGAAAQLEKRQRRRRHQGHLGALLQGEPGGAQQQSARTASRTPPAALRWRAT